MKVITGDISRSCCFSDQDPHAMDMLKRNPKIRTVVHKSPHKAKPNLTGIQRLREGCLIIGVLFAVLMAVSLITFNPADPSWSQTAWGGEVKNAGGLMGAWIGDTLLFIFGVLAYFVPAIIVLLSWIVFRKRTDAEPVDLMLWGTRLLGGALLIVTSCGLAELNFDDIWNFSSGGVVGDVITSLALPTLNSLGSTLALLFFWGASFTLFTGISWLSIVERIGQGTLWCVTSCLNFVRGDKEQVLEPTRLDDQKLVYADTSPEATQPVTESIESTIINDPLLAPSDEAPVEDTPYKIYMPEDSEEETFTFDRTSNLNAPIDQLERDAQLANDYADTEEPVIDTATQPLELNQDSTPEMVIPEVEEHFSATEEIVEEKPSFQPPTLESDPLLEDEQQHSHNHDSELVGASSDFDIVEEPEKPEPSISVESLDDVEQQIATPEDDDEDVIVEELTDAEAFAKQIADEKAKQAASQNPFLIRKDADLPVPTSPMPTLELLYHPEKRENHIDREALQNIARLVESKLADYKIKAAVVGIFPGPVITRFELDLAPGVKVSRISSLSMDLARSLSALAVRVVEVIPGKPYVGLELPNMTRQTVFLSDVICSPQFIENKSPTAVVLGQDIAGDAVVADLSKMPHVLVAGTTGSGKSVGVNVMILSMLYKSTPDDVRFIMIDPKMLELSIYEGIPHLLSEVVTDMKDASNALRWCVGEMERRYKLMSALGVRNLKGFNDKLKMAADAGHPIHDPLWQPGDSMDQEAPLLEKLPYIVVVVDEFADLIMVVGKKVEELIARIAQKARAAGIHLILATQRPSVDVITGLIKANIPTRVAFTVSTKTDSRTILDQGGAESLLGMGDMLYLPPGSSHTIRVHGAFASDDDVHAVVNDWKARGKPQYIDEITKGEPSPETLLPGEKMEGDEDTDPLFDQVVEHVTETRRGSVSGVQRKFKIGYNRAARIVEQLEAQGIVSAPGHNGNREVLAPPPIKDM